MQQSGQGLHMAQRWVMVAFAALCSGLTVGTTMLVFTLWVHPWSVDFNEPLKNVMGIVGLSMFVTGCSGPFIGMLIDKVPLRLLIAVTGSLFALGLALISQAAALWQIALIYCTLVPIGRMGAGANTTMAVALRAIPHRAGLALGIVSMGPSIAGLLIPQIVVRLMESLGWRTTHLVLAVVVFVLIVPFSLLIVRPPPIESGADQPLATPKHGDNGRSVILTILTSAPYWGIAISCLALVALYTGVLHSIGPLTLELGYAATTTATVLSTLHAMHLVGNAAFGVALDRMRSTWLYVILTVGAVLGIWLFSVGHPVALMFAAASVVGLVGGGIQPLLAAMVVQAFGTASFGRAIGLVAVITATGGAGAYVIGFFRETLGSFDLALRAMILCIVPFTAAILLVLKSRSHTAGRWIQS